MNKNSQKQGFSRLVELTGKYKILLIVGCILSGISAILTLGPYISIYFIIQEILSVGGNMSLVNTSLLINYGWLALILAISGIVVNFIALMCTHVVAFKTIKNIRFDLLKHLSTLSLGFHSVNPSGKVRKILETNSGQLEDFIAHNLPDLIGSIVSPIVIVFLLLFFDWKLGIISLIPLVLGFAIQYRMMRNNMRNNCIRIYQESLEDMNSSAVEYVRGISVVKVFGQTIYSFKNFYDSIIKYKDYVVKFTLSMEKSMSLFVTIINSSFFLLIPAGILLVTYTTNLESFVLSFIFYVIFTPVAASMLMKIMYVAPNQMMINESLRKIDLLYNEKPLEEPTNPQYPENYNIELKNISFAYESMESNNSDSNSNSNNNDNSNSKHDNTVNTGENEKETTNKTTSKYAIKDVSLKINEGEKIALVGASGSGKSTIANLIPRFWDVAKGSIEIDSINIKNIATKNLMDYITIVFQDTHLFKESILENIRFGNPDANREQILNAAKLAQCDDILENSPIIIFDEATAFADPENEYKIQLALEELTKNKTVIMIAHRLSSIKNLDQILVMKDGFIAEKGTHSELIGKKGLYFQMWEEYKSGLSWNVSKKDKEKSEKYNFINKLNNDLNNDLNKDVNPDV